MLEMTLAVLLSSQQWPPLIDIDDGVGGDGNHGRSENSDKFILEKTVPDTFPI